MRIARVYFDVDLRCSFQGLRKFLTKEKIDPISLGKGNLIIFMNRRATSFKMLAGNDYLVYYNNSGRRIPLDAIQYLPTYFDGTSLEFNKAMEKSVRDKLRIE